MLTEKINQLISDFAEAVAEAAETDFRARMATLLNAGTSEVPEGYVTAAAHARKSAKGKVAKKTSTAGRLARRTPEQIAAVVAGIVKLLSKHKEGMRSEEIRKALDLDVREVPRVLKDGISSGAIKVLSGQKRSTCYGVGGGRKVSAKSRKPAKKVGAKKAKKAVRAKAAPKKASSKSKKAPKKAAKASSKKTVKKTKASKSASNGIAGHAAAAAEATA